MLLKTAAVSLAALGALLVLVVLAGRRRWRTQTETLRAGLRAAGSLPVRRRIGAAG